MHRTTFAALIATTALTAPMPAFAQDDQPQSRTEASDSGEIVVTARREAESLQEVPVSVQVVTGDRLEKLAITSVDEISKLAPGLTLSGSTASTGVTLRGVTWQPGSGTPATPIYFNEAPFDPEVTIQSLFDVGQIEVLRGPQGTSRGAPSISGAVTITTRKPNLEQFGGYIQGLYGEGDHTALQGAINVPVLKDVLAFRLATNIEDSNLNRVRSVNSAIDPKLKDRTFRATMLLNPTETVSILAMYQRRQTERASFTQVAGTGSPGFAALGIRPNFNGPALSVKDRRSVLDLPSTNDEKIDLLTVNANWEVFGHKLSYNFGRQFNRNRPTFNAQDTLNILPGSESFLSVARQGLADFATHEIRVSSLPDPDRPFDYDLGWFSKHSNGTLIVGSPAFLPGAFGAPFQSVPGQVTTPNSRYVLNSRTSIALGQVFDSFYGSARFRLGDRTELSGGLAIVRDRVPVRLDITATPAFVAFANFLPPAAGGCPAPGFLPPSPVYGPGYCEVAVAPTFAPQINNNKYSDVLYNFSVSHKFSDAVLAYATTGSSFRTGLPAINNTGLPANLIVPEPETAKSYELGVKTSWGRGLTVNAAVFQLDYKDQLTTFEGVSYLNAVTGQPAQTSIAFYRGIDSRVRGGELEIAARPIDNLTLGVNLSYSKIKSRGGQVPCNDAARPITTANPINFCTSPKGQVLNTTSPFQATVNGSYEVPLGDSFAAYVRFNVNYRGKNPNFGNFRTGSVFKSTPSYAIVDLFAGLTGNDDGWNLGVYAKNVFDKQVELNRVFTPNTIFPLFAAPSGYDVVRTNLPRELGVTVRYAFGSR